MTKTMTQIQFEMETVKLIKSALDVNGDTAYRMFKEWTSEDGGIKFSGTIENSKVEVKNNSYVSSQDIKEIKETLDGIVKLVCASSGMMFD